MAVLLISYDLNRGERPSSYTAVRQIIEQHATSAVKPLYSQWFVETSETPQTWSDRIGTVADSDDSWFVCHVKRPYQGWLPKSVWEWLDARTS